MGSVSCARGVPQSRGVRFGAIVAVFLLTAGLSFHSRADEDLNAGHWFFNPSAMPKDVFDLPEFDRYVANRKLDVVTALADLAALSDSNLPDAQRLFDILAWRTFVALNWPALKDGAPDTSKGFGDETTPKVWEYWQPTSAVFLPDGNRPVWQGTDVHALDHFKAGWRANASVNEGLQAFSGPLIDQNGQWVHYVSFMNHREFDYIVENELYNLEGQAKFQRTHRIEFPQNDDLQAGAIEIKLAWKVLTPQEIKSHRFLVRELPVVEYRPASSMSTLPPAHLSGKTADNATSPQPTRRSLGLIRMHIAMRTRAAPQWIWATFEQVDNTRLNRHSGDREHPLPAYPSLSNPNNPIALVGANLLPAYNATGPNGPISDWDEAKPMSPVEVLRLVPPPQETDEVNVESQAFLAARGSVLRFYELDGTQWPTHPTAPAIPGGMPGGVGSAPESIIAKMPGEVVPVYLTNATMETYFQHGLQPAAPLEQDNRTTLIFDSTMVFGTESCAGCHYSAGACIGFRKDAAGKLLHDAKGAKIPIFGENANDGLNGNANFSWLLQLEAKAKHPTE